MKELLQKIEKRMDDFTVKKKLYILYIFCVLLPLIITDSVVFLIIRNSEMEKQKHDMTNIANAVSYNISSVVNNAGEMAKTIYTSRYIDDFLSRKYDTSAQYIMEYQEFFKDTLLENLLGMNQIVFTMYTNNDTIVKGGKVGNIEDLKETQAYQKLNQSGETKGFFFVYDKNRSGTAEERKVVFLQKLDFFSGDQEKMLQLEFDYGNMMRTLQKMNFDNEVLICEENQIVLSNTKHGSTGSDFEELDDKIKKGYHQTVNLYGTELEVYVRRTGENAIANIAHDLPSILLLILINAILPFFFVHILNHSFTKRITELNEVFKSVDSEQLVPMRHEGGKDEIGSMIRSYNRMAARTNELIQTVYKNKLVEQEMLVSRKNAELLALHSQINPHFLFNALESIRMHSILKNENETADMVEKLAVMQRQYVEWGEDSVTIEQEVEFVKAYLALQKYRFGERLSYQIEIDEECRKRKVPKLTLVTFVENACVHGIESKASPGWIFVRVYEQNELICMEIEDTGNGMEEGKRQELLENMRNADIEMLKKKGRVGIVNACLRLKMVSENKVKIDLDGEEGVGTLITIRMPGMTGLELLEQIRREEISDAYFVILSGYAEFDYARRAMQNKCTEYLLKPVDRETLLKLLHKVRALSDRERQESKAHEEMEHAYFSRHLISLIHGKYDDVNLNYVKKHMKDTQGIRYVEIQKEQPNNLEEQSDKDLRNFQRELYDCCREFLKEDAKHCVFDVSADEKIYDIGFVYSENLAERLGMDDKTYLSAFRQYLVNNTKQPVIMLVGKKVPDISNVARSYGNACMLRSFQGFRARKEIYYYEDEVQVTAAGMVLCKQGLDQLLTTIEQNNHMEIRKAVEQFYEEMSQMGMNAESMNLNINYLLFQLIHLASEQDNDVNQEEILRLISESSFENGILRGSKAHMARFACEYGDYLSQLRKNVSRGVLGMVEKEIKENYAANLTLKGLSEKYYVNSAYLGQLFRKKYGLSFKDYLNNFRMEQAAGLLIRTDKKIVQIAEEVGYHDLDYFVNRFIQVKGCTPARFRKQMQQGS